MLQEYPKAYAVHLREITKFKLKRKDARRLLDYLYEENALTPEFKPKNPKA